MGQTKCGMGARRHSALREQHAQVAAARQLAQRQLLRRRLHDVPHRREQLALALALRRLRARHSDYVGIWLYVCDK